MGLNQPELNIERVHSRVKAGGRHIDEDFIRRRFVESRQNLLPAMQSAEKVFIYDNSKDFSELLFSVTGRQEQMYLIDYPCPWQQEILQTLLSHGYRF